MREVTYKRLTLEGFAKYGSWANMVSASGPCIGASPIEYYRDIVQSSLGAIPVVSFGICRVQTRPFIMDISEFHDACCEVVLPLDGDVLMHVAPAVPQAEFPFDQAEVFLVPRGTILVLRPGVWHHAPFAFRSDCVNCLIGLPERTYVNDCTMWPFPAERYLRIVGEGTS